jgi:hypothetical protein
MQTPRRPPPKAWYTVSVETLKGWGIFFTLLTVGGVGFLVYRYWESAALEREAKQVILEAQELVQRVQGIEGFGTFHAEYDAAWKSLEEARARATERAYGPALEAGKRSRALLLSILDALKAQSPLGGEAQFIAVQGEVLYRRGDHGDWEDAHSRVVLRSGDFVKTSGSGSAEIVFTDGTLYTVRPNTLFLVTRTQTASGGPGEQSIQMEYGWVNLNTTQQVSRVTTPRSEARISKQSEAVVAYDSGSKTGRFAAYRGSMEVAANGGLTQSLSELQQVVQTGDLLSTPKPLPGPPAVLGPSDRTELRLADAKQVALEWQPIPAAARYALQVSRNRLFVDNLVDVDSRTKTRATLGIRGPGSFEWRVAAISREGLQGPWSPARGFRVSPVRSGASDGDKIPPALEIDEVKAYGSIFMLAGKTEPGAVLVVDGEPVAVAADGSFNKTVQLGKEGWSFVEIRARDAAGNETVKRRRVFVETL